MMKRTLLTLAIISMVCFSVSSAMKYYAYGDSITLASEYCGFASDGSDSYINKLSASQHATPYRNIDGGGMTSQWGSKNKEKHFGYSDNYDYVFIFFGNNDLMRHIYGDETGKNIEDIYMYTVSIGSQPIILLPTIMNTSIRDNYTIQGENILKAQRYLDSKNIKYIKTYEVNDKNKSNGIPDEADPNGLCDGIHPTKDVHTEISKLILRSGQLKISKSIVIPLNTTSMKYYDLLSKKQVDEMDYTKNIIYSNKDLTSGDSENMIIVRV